MNSISSKTIYLILVAYQIVTTLLQTVRLYVCNKKRQSKGKGGSTMKKVLKKLIHRLVGWKFRKMLVESSLGELCTIKDTIVASLSLVNNELELRCTQGADKKSDDGGTFV